LPGFRATRLDWATEEKGTQIPIFAKRLHRRLSTAHDIAGSGGLLVAAGHRAGRTAMTRQFSTRLA